MSFSSWQMICGHHWAATGTLWQNHQTLTNWHPKAKFFSMHMRRFVCLTCVCLTLSKQLSIWMWHLKCLKVYFPPLSKLCVLPAGRPCWQVAGQTQPGSMTSTPTGESILETTPPCHSTLNLGGTSPCLWARYSIQASNQNLFKIFSQAGCADSAANLGSATEIPAEWLFLKLQKNHRLTVS